MAEFSPIDLQKALSGADYPADRDQLVKLARDHGADQKLIDKLSKLGKKRYENPAEVSKEVFQHS